MARTLTAAEIAALPPDERERRQRSAAQATAIQRDLHVVPEENLALRLDGTLIVAGDDTYRAASPEEVAVAIERYPMYPRLLDSIAANRRVLDGQRKGGNGHAGTGR